MSWRVELTPHAIRQLAKLDRARAKILTAWLRKNLEGCENPRTHGKPLTGGLAGAWRYRVGDYRILCELRDSELLVLAFEIAHRSEVYNRARRRR